MLLRGRTFALRPSVKVGGGAIGAMPMSLPVGSRGVSRVPLLPVPLGIGFPGQFRRVPLEGIAFASVGGQAGGKRPVRRLQPMPTPVSPARSWACCIASSTLRPTRRSTGRRSALRLRHTVAPAPVTLSLGVRSVSVQVLQAAPWSRLRHACSVKVGGGAIGAMPMSLPIGSGGVSRVPLLPVPHGIGVPAQFRLVPVQGIAFAQRRGQAGRTRVLRKLQFMQTPVYPACSWACCAGPVNLTPNPAVNRTPICVTSSARGGAGAGYLFVGRH